MLRAMRTLAHLRSALLPLLTGALFAVAASAQGNDVDLVLEGKKASGQRPRLIVKANKDIATVELVLTAGGQRHRLSGGPLARGAELGFDVPHEELGTRRWSGTLSVRFADESSGSMPLAFDTEVLAPPGLRVVSDQQEIQEQHRIALEMDRPASKVDVEVYGDGGRVMASTSRTFDAAPAGTRLEVPWVPRLEGPALRVKVTAWDTGGMFVTSESFPWSLSIPHEEVVCESGRAEIRPAEEPKLKAAVLALRREVTRYAGSVAIDRKRIHLFVAGHTDTVGPSSSNRKLSEERARSIARWFRRAGIDILIYYRGFGEDVPKVATPDETDEAQNRRADYDIAVEPPTGSFEGWTRL